jgi:hypothetical protein
MAIEKVAAAARAANPGLDLVIGALVTNVFQPTVLSAPRPTNVVRLDDLAFHTDAAVYIARTIGSQSG